MKVAIADDDSTSRRLLRRHLERWGYGVEEFSDGLSAWNALQQENAPDLVVIDWQMPHLTGLELCRALRADHSERHRYLILLTERHAQHDKVAGLDAGADDYLLKPFDPQELRLRVRNGERILEMQHDLITARDTLRQRATFDGLTGLLNRTAGLELLEVKLREEQRPTVLLIDIDDFKEINDTHGHPAGDRVLCDVAKQLKSGLEEGDFVARLGGEEFLVVLRDREESCARDQAMRLITRIATNVAIPGCDGRSVTISAGVVYCDVDEPPRNGGELIGLADEALYAAKRHGKNRAEFTLNWSASMSANA